MSEQAAPFKFTVDLAVVESLGINLYSNAAAVLSELVANAWDADANNVYVDWEAPSDEIRIRDDGCGMTREQLNDRFLTVAYKKRSAEGGVSARLGRSFMGRKGIGKLSVFSLANTVEVYSARDGQKNAFRIVLEDLKISIDKHETYEPVEISCSDTELPEHGTTIVLHNLNSKRAGVSVAALRRRIARRFDILALSVENDDEQTRADDPERFDNRFNIVVNEDPVTYKDREDLRRVQYIWQLGTEELPAERTPNAKARWVMNENTIDEKKGWKLEGWFGTVNEPDDLNDPVDEGESLSNIIILARKRPIQEGIIRQLKFNKLFGNYVTGQIRAEFLDDEVADDIATSDRQRLIEDDERVQALIKRLRLLFNKASDQWSAERPRQKFIELTKAYPVVQQWIETRPATQRDAATKLMRTVAGLRLEDEKQRRELYKSGILAFERIAIESSTAELNSLADGLFAADLLPVLANARSYQDALYLQILHSRLEAIQKLESLINVNEKEKVLQKHLFENMWLLDPSWEGATGDVTMEEGLQRIRGDLFERSEAVSLAQGRIDIRYMNAAGVHMIVELKRYQRTVGLDELVEQGAKYHQALSQVLHRKGVSNPSIAVVFVIGQEPSMPYLGSMSVDEMVKDRMKSINGRILYYDGLLSSAQHHYQEYREAHLAGSTLDQTLRALDAPPTVAAQG